MKKMIRTLTVLIAVVLMLAVLAMPALAAEFDFETEISEFNPTSLNTYELKAGETHTPGAALWADNGECYSSDETIATVSTQGNVTAVSEGTAYIAIVASTGQSMIYRYDVTAAGENNNDLTQRSDWSERVHNSANDIMKQHKDMQERIQSMFTVMMIVCVVLVLFGIAEVVYIYIAAPKCGMSRLWALVPIFSNFIGLIVFIVVRSGRKTTTATNTIMCPTCNGVHPCGTEKCNICGTKLQ